MLYLPNHRPLNKSPARLLGLLALTLFLCVTNSQAESPTARVTASIVGPSLIRIQIEFSSPANTWSFRNAYAGALGLGDRIEQFQASRSGKAVPVRKVAAGEFRSDLTAERVSYVVRIPPGPPGDLAHISWLTSDFGLLMLSDLLPESEQRISLMFEMPDGWLAQSSSNRDQSGRYSLDKPEEAVFFIGQGLRSSSKTVQGIALTVVANHSWNESDKSFLKSASKVLEWYLELTRFKLRGNPTILLVPLPLADSATQWKAETRGSTIVLVMNPRAAYKNWSAQLGIILTHEILHLWIPNSLALSGAYDWFFEGFSLYLALQAALKLKLIPFQEYLDTLARVYDSYLSYANEQTLIEAAEKRWTSSAPVVYDRGMLVAFVYDLIVRRATSETSSVADLYRELLRTYADEPANANDVIIKLLDSSPATNAFSSQYVEGRTRIELEKVLPAFGLEMNTNGGNSRLHILEHLSKDQRDLLRSLGYRK